MRILYAASNRKYACVQMDRIIKHLNPIFEIKTASFLGPLISSTDWNLNALINFIHPKFFHLKGENYEIYAAQVKNFSPDLILSDLELYTSTIGIDLNIPVWQVSPILAYYGLPSNIKKQIKLSQYNSLFDPISGQMTEEKFKILKNVLSKSERKLVYSHFGDLGLKLVSGYEWLRPFYLLGKESKTCQHESVSICPDEDKNLIKACKQFKDTVIFGYNKDILNQTEYACNLKNAENVYTNGITDYCSDAFYNGKYNYLIPNFTINESVLNTVMSIKNRIGSIAKDKMNKNNTVVPNKSKDIKDLLGELV